MKPSSVLPRAGRVGLYAIALLFVMCSLCVAVGPDQTSHAVVVMCLPDDPYWALAEELAQQQGCSVVTSVEAALAHNPTTLYWVATPEGYSEERFAEWGRAIMDHDAPLCLGLVSGQSIDSARALVQSRPDLTRPMVSIVPREGYLETWRDPQGSQRLPLELGPLVETLASSSYAVYQGHGTRRDWHIGQDAHLAAADLPLLPGTLVNALACQTLKLWSEDAIAPGFTDAGASAYVGFLHSPQGYVIGEPKGFPAQNTWPGFDLGKLVQVQNRGLCQGHMAWPYYIILGDPHLSMAVAPPYQVASDRVNEDSRSIVLCDAPSGVIPVRIDDGSRYDYVRTATGAVAWRGDPFYDADLQMVDIADAKYLLLTHTGGDIELTLHKSVPLSVRLFEPLSDALDHLTVVQHAAGSIAPNAILALLVWIAVGLVLWRKKTPLRDSLMPALWSGITVSLAQTLYALVRRDDLSTLYTGYLRTQDVGFGVSPLVVLSGLATTVGGAWLICAAKKPPPKVLAVLAATAPLSIISLFWFGSNALLNQLARQRYGIPLYGYAMGSMAAIAWAIEAILLLMVLGLHGWIARKRSIS